MSQPVKRRHDGDGVPVPVKMQKNQPTVAEEDHAINVGSETNAGNASTSHADINTSDTSIISAQETTTPEIEEILNNASVAFPVLLKRIHSPDEAPVPAKMRRNEHNVAEEEDTLYFENETLDQAVLHTNHNTSNISNRSTQESHIEEQLVSYDTENLGETEYAIDLDEDDRFWLEVLNYERAVSGKPFVLEEQFDRVLEKLLHVYWLNSQPTCDICKSCKRGKNFEMLVCSKCNIYVHQNCYGHIPRLDGPWTCKTCLSKERAICKICEREGGVMKRTPSQRWLHKLCEKRAVKWKDMSAEQSRFVRRRLIQSIEDKINARVSIEDIGHALDIDEEVRKCIFNYWKHKQLSDFHYLVLLRNLPKIENKINRETMHADKIRFNNLCQTVSEKNHLFKQFLKLEEQERLKQFEPSEGPSTEVIIVALALSSLGHLSHLMNNSTFGSNARQEEQTPPSLP